MIQDNKTLSRCVVVDAGEFQVIERVGLGFAKRHRHRLKKKTGGKGSLIDISWLLRAMAETE